MSFSEILYSIFISPLQVFFEVLFVFANGQLHNPGLAIIALSLVMNFLVLPLYRRADAIQEEERDIEAKLARGVAHIKKVFKGDEKMMMLRTYYRQNHYMPTDAFKGSLSLFLEIPFFIAAYQFLSNLTLLHGVSLGPIRDLGTPDALLTVAGVSVNVLPILMTVVNLVSSAIFVQGYPLKTKVQLYAMALFFLVFLYNSPAGLVFYWTLNNLFSLVKTILYKLKNPKRFLAMLVSFIGIGLIIDGVFFPQRFLRGRIILVLVGLLFQVWLLLQLGYIRVKSRRLITSAPNPMLFRMSTAFLTVLIGVLIPSAVIVASPKEFVDIQYFMHPLWYLVSAGCLAVGTFGVWMSVFYWIADAAGKVVIERILWCGSGIALVDYMFFGKNYGILSAVLKFDHTMTITYAQRYTNFGVLLAVCLLLCVILYRYKKAVSGILLTGILAVAGMSALNAYNIWQEIIPLQAQLMKGEAVATDKKLFHLSKSGKNVIVLMLDRGIGPYIPYIFNEKPELKEQFKGFTYYANTISFGQSTNFGSPALFGGYEYTPAEMNKRSDVKLATKQNEALKVMPEVFYQNGYDVTVCNPQLTNYSWDIDLSIFEEYPDIHTYNLHGLFGTSESKEQLMQNNKRNFFFYSLMKAAPLFLQQPLYDGGQYNQVTFSSQKANGISEARGVSPNFVREYNVLRNLSNITDIRTDTKDTFLFMANDTPHEPMLLQKPEYSVSEQVDNKAYDAQHKDVFTVAGRRVKMDTVQQAGHYAANMVTFIELGRWFDYLRELGVYENTRIILVSDHGYDIKQFEDLLLKQNGKVYDMEGFTPILMVKDFGAQQFATSNAFMTNGDVPALAFSSLIPNPVNPSTGKMITNAAKYEHDQYVLASSHWDVKKNGGTQFLPDDWFAVHDNIWNKENWKFNAGHAVLPKE